MRSCQRLLSAALRPGSRQCAHPAPLVPQLQSHCRLRPVCDSARSFSLTASLGVHQSRVILPQRGLEPDDELTPSRPTAVEVEQRNRREVRERREAHERRHLAFNAYNLDLSRRVKQCESWSTLLPLIARELWTTEYNVSSSQRWLSPNRKHEQLTPQAVCTMVLQLIKTRGTRRRVLQDDALMSALHRLVVVLETMAPALHSTHHLWHRLCRPHRYLRAQLDSWMEAKQAARRAALRQEDEERELQRVQQSEQGVVSADDMRRRAEVARKRRAARSAAALDEEEEDAAGTARSPVLNEARELAGVQQWERMSRDERLQWQLRRLIDRDGAEQEEQQAQQMTAAEKLKQRRLEHAIARRPIKRGSKYDFVREMVMRQAGRGDDAQAEAARKLLEQQARRGSSQRRMLQLSKGSSDIYPLTKPLTF